MKQSKNIFPIILFVLLSLLIIFPLLPPGYILTLDAVSTGRVLWPSFFSNSFLFGSLYALWGLLIPTYWLQKLILFLIFFLSSFGMYRFVPVKNNLIKIFAGLFYAINPFVYERVMAGQWHFLLGYALFPFIISATLDFFQNPGQKQAIKLAILATILFSIVIHYTLVFAGFFVVYGVIYCLFHRGEMVRVFGYLPFFLGLTLLLNANWLTSTLLGRSSVSQNISQFSHEDLVAFQSVPDKRFGLIFNLLSGYGFWPEAHDYFILAKSLNFIWPLFSVVFILISLYGVVELVREKEEKSLFPLAVTLVIVFLFSLDLAGGVALKPFAQTAFWLYQKFIPLRGFREPQKLVGNLMFCYAFLGSFGFSSLLNKVEKGSMFYVLCFIFLILPFIYTPTIFGGFWGQLKPVFYPASWEKVNKILKEDKDEFLTVFFPWHMYMRFGFNNDRVVANPAPYYFDQPILSSRNYETKPLYSHDARPEALHVDGLLNIQMKGKNLLGDPVDFFPDWGRDLAAVDVKYLILAKDDDWKEYKFLDRVFDFSKVYESDELILYQNLFWGKEIPLPEQTEDQLEPLIDSFTTQE